MKKIITALSAAMLMASTSSIAASGDYNDSQSYYETTYSSSDSNLQSKGERPPRGEGDPGSKGERPPRGEGKPGSKGERPPRGEGKPGSKGERPPKDEEDSDS